MDFFQNMDSYLRLFWYIAIPVSLVFIIQSIMTFAGMDGNDGTSADFDGDLSDGHAPFQLFSLRNLINFLLGFSWTGISFFGIIENKFLLITVALLIGCGMVAMFFVIIKQILKLSEDNTFKIGSCLNKTGTVYINIPAQKSGSGKVQISVRSAFHELEAITNSPEKLVSGTSVKVIEIIDNKILVVEKI